jgi:general L-amino acid transport system substrate-binding protein
MRRSALLFLVAAALAAACGGHATSRMSRIRQRGFLVCGVLPGIAGFAQVDRSGHYTGFDIDLCRAVAAAVVGSAERIRYEPVVSLDLLKRSSDIDLVSRRLTWSLRREGMGVLFGPITFYDGQGFLVAGHPHVDGVAGLAGVPICVAELSLERVGVADGSAAGRALAEGRCQAFSADVSELASVRSTMADPHAFQILADRITSEPLAQLVRQEDVDLFNVLRWTVFAMITAEELGVTSGNIGEMVKSENPEVGRLLGTVPGNGAALGLDEAWARRVIADVGNYAEVFERNLGTSTPIGMERGSNALWSSGGLLFAPPLK